MKGGRELSFTIFTVALSHLNSFWSGIYEKSSQLLLSESCLLVVNLAVSFDRIYPLYLDSFLPYNEIMQTPANVLTYKEASL
jgi:hypothetical protein